MNNKYKKILQIQNIFNLYFWITLIKLTAPNEKPIAEEGYNSNIFPTGMHTVNLNWLKILKL